MLALAILLLILLRIPAVQNYISQQVTAYLEKKIETPFRVGSVYVDFPKMLVLEDVYIEDRSRDTLLAGDKIRVDINLLRLLRNVVEINQVELSGITGNINRSLPDQTFNFAYIIDSFVDPNQEPEPEAAPADSTAPMVISIERIRLEGIHLTYHDEVIGLSTAIHLAHLDTRIETFDLQGDMHFAVPQIAIQGLNGYLEQWTSPIPSDTSTSALPQIDLDRLHLEDIDFSYRHADMGLDSRFSWKDLSANIDVLDLVGGEVAIQEIALNRSDSHVIFAAVESSGEDTTETELVEAEEETGEEAGEGAGWNIRVGKLLINETDFLYRDDNLAHIPRGFDYTNIGITGLQGHLEDFIFTPDSIAGRLEMLRASDQSGFEIDHLSSSFVYTDEGAELDQLMAQTPHTRLTDYIRIAYPSLERLSSDPGVMQIRADLQNSYVGMQDVLYFLPDLDTMQFLQPLLRETVYIDGQVRGRVDNLEIPSLRFRALDQTVLHASAQVRGLPDVDNMALQLNLQELSSSQQDLNQLLPAGTLPDSIRLPQSLTLRGTMEGDMQAFDADLELETTVGNASLMGSYQVNRTDATSDTTYQAQLALMDIQLGHILAMDSVLGGFSFAGSLSGQGLDPKQMIAELEGELLHLDAWGYTYQGIELAANAEEGAIQARINSADTNVDFDLQAQANLRDTYPRVHAELMIDSVNLKNLNLMEEEFRYHGRMVVDLETADLDHLNGTVKILNSSIAYNDERYTFDSINLLAEAQESANLLQLNAEFLYAHLVGNYTLSELGPAIQDIIAVYYQPDSVAPVFTYGPQQFDFSAQLTRSRFIRDFLPDLTEMEDITLDGSFNSEDKFLLMKAHAPRLRYGGVDIREVSLDVTTFDSTMYYSSLIEQIRVSDVELMNTLLSGTVVQNQLDFGLWIKDREEVERYRLGVEAQVDAGDFVVSLKENGLMLNYDEWEIDPENALIFGTSGVNSRNFIMSQGDQRLMIMSHYEELNSPLDLIFENFRIETFSKMLESDVLNMGGGINGLVSFSRLNTANPIFISDLEIDQFYFGQDTIGNVAMRVNNERGNTYAARIDIRGQGNEVSLDGRYLALPGEKPELDFVLNLNPMSMTTLQAFSLGYLHRTSGSLNGQLQVSGTVDQPRLDGELVFRDASMNVRMLNANFSLNDQKILFDNQGVRFNRFELRDSKNNTARLNGTIQTQNYRNFDFNLTLQADRFQVLNSTRQDLDLFYGQLIVSSNLRVTGGLNNPIINGNLMVEDDTHVTFVLPSEDPGVVERDGIIRFVNRSDTSTHNVFARLDSMRTSEISGLRMSMTIQTHPSAAFSIVIDEGSGDALNIQGAADLTAGLDPAGNITLTGTYRVEEGNYSFTFEPVKRVFDFKQGSTITWTGDPMDARLAITAVYQVKAPTLELVQGQIGGESENLYKQRVPFDVNLGITGQMLQPQLDFGIDLDEDNSMISQDVASKVNTALNQLQEDESEMNKQVFALIVMGRFLAANPFESVSGGSAGSLARNSVSSLLSSQLNRLAGDLIHGVDLDFDLQSGDDYSTGQSLSRTDLNIGVSKMLLDERLKVTVGSNFALEGNLRPGEQTTNIAGDIAVDYQLSKSNRYLLRVYRKNQYQVTLQGQFVETGIGFIINLDYNEFREIFMNSQELADLYSTDNRDFQRRFDRERMATDTVYRDSVRQVIRDSLRRVDPEALQRFQERQSSRDRVTSESFTKDTATRRRLYGY